MLNKFLVSFGLFCFSFSAQTEACKLFCEECPHLRQIQQFYCCQENWQAAPVVRTCFNTPPGPVTEWVCPTDPIMRPAVELQHQYIGAGPQICQYDNQCAQNPPVPEKCCYDSAMARTVCKPAMLRN